MTNGDRIRAMDNVELAKTLYWGTPSICKICKVRPKDDVIAPILSFLNDEYVPEMEVET